MTPRHTNCIRNAEKVLRLKIGVGCLNKKNRSHVAV